MLTGYRIWIVVLVAVWLGAGPLSAAPATAPSQAAPAPTADEVPAVDSLYRSSVSLLLNASAPARASRMVTLLEFAHALDPTDARVARMLGDLRLAGEAYDAAAEAFQVALNRRSDDHALQLQLLALHLRRLQRADQRLEMLTSVAADQALPAALRAQAAVEAAAIEFNRARGEQARSLLRRALELDPHHPLARLQLAPATAPAARTQPASVPASAPAGRLTLSVAPVRAVAAVGEPLAVEVTLTNAGQALVPLSAGGAPGPVVRLRATTGDDKRAPKPFADLPPATLPAPAYLAPGQAVRTTVDLDAGALHAYLVARPLERVELTVTGELAGASSQPASLARASLGADARTLDAAMLDIVRAVKRGQAEDKMRAARRVGAMLRLHERAAEGETKLPADLGPNACKPMLLSMMRALMGDSGAAVRAEMITALQDLARLDATMRELLAPAWRDSSSLVRLRVLELYVTHRPTDWRVRAAAVREDADPRLRLLAKAAL